jgi:hypothetical protein
VGGLRARVDTRNKILTLDAALGLEGPIAAAAGYFDVLRAEHVRELVRLRACAPEARLLVMVLPMEGAALTQPARAELAAALRAADFVVLADESETAQLREALRPVAFLSMEADDRRRSRELREHVHRQSR